MTVFNRARALARPRRAFTLVAGAFAVLLLAGCMTAGQTRVLKELNHDRTDYGLRALPDSKTAQRKAQAWADHMARTGTISHSRLTDGYGGRSVCVLGENVGVSSSAAAVEAAYMNSAPHRANILSPRWNYVGVGYSKSGHAVYVVQEFVQYC